MKIPEPTNTIAKAIYDSYKQGEPREHLGCSLLGHHCDRWLWLSFRWAVIEKFNGRILRLFERGQNEEATVVANLKAIGCEVEGQQYRVDFGNHISGSLDGVVMSGIPESKKPHVLEIKTHSKKSFDDLVKNGVEKSKPMHYAQMQLYMMGTNLDRALYFAVCKDNDEIYTERVRYVKETASMILERGHRIVSSDRMPEPCSADPSWYQCKFCPAHSFCHEDHLTKEVNCRTCANVTIKPDSIYCEKYQAAIPGNAQKAGCEGHVLHPDLVPWDRKESNNEWQAVYIVNGKPVANGEADANVYGSKELIANAAGCAMDDEISKDMREIFGARVVG